MIQFLVYLFESGLCLTLLFLVYYLFLRKETYFTFNRIYLISILILSLLLPMIHLKFTVPESEAIEKQVTGIKKFRSYYEQLILLTDPDYPEPFTKPFRVKDFNIFESTDAEFLAQSPPPENSSKEIIDTKNKTGFWAQINWARILLIFYLTGVLFFAMRLILLFHWLNQILRKYGYHHNDGVKLVKMDEEVPPFSFFRFIFLNRETNSLTEFEQIVAHEKVHIQQRHSLDLLLAHFITVFQWFNPFVWLINKAMKTNHEYIADRNVVEQGYELFDYQSLLLKQMISIRSVELVNNFNLINIKKRIAMMTKIKSGLAAQVKALVVIPAAMFLFFFFAEISFAQNAVGFQNKDISKEIQGFWKNTDENSYGQLLYFNKNELQILEDKNLYQELGFDFITSSVSMTKEFFESMKIKEYVKDIHDLSLLTVHINNSNSKIFYVALTGKNLIIGWSNSQVSIYNRIDITNSLELLTKNVINEFEPVPINYYRLTDHPERTTLLLMDKNGKMFMNNKSLTLDKLEQSLSEEISKGNPFESVVHFITLNIDARCTMKSVWQLLDKMRDINQLLHILSGSPSDKKVPEVFYHNVGIPRRLPPKGPETVKLDVDMISDSNLIWIDLTIDKISFDDFRTQLEQKIQRNPQYIIILKYDNKVQYKDYLTSIDLAYQVIYEKRNQLAQQKYNLKYDDLPTIQQQEILRSYPLRLSEQNIDQPED
ncbi:MAG: M56 family metallopeptidase [Prolixibacteraceae bacterium]|nr:M56 family metallopeptidase [Prolixibacteraceae bacterium]